MSSKKRRHSGKSSGSVNTRSKGSQLANESDSDTKKFNPKARNLLFTDLVLLAIATMAERAGVLPSMVSLVITVIGFVLMLLAFYFQFGGGDSSGGPPRL